MASPQESITTVNGRRCTRSRARTAATSIFTTQEPAAVAPTEVTTSTAVEQAPQIQTSAVEAPPPPPPPPPAPAESSTTQAEQPAAAPTTTQAAVSSAIGTISAIPTPSSSTTPLALPAVAPSRPAPAGPKGPVAAAEPAVIASQAVVATSASSAVPATTSSDTISAAVQPQPPSQSSRPAPSFPGSGGLQSAILQTSVATDPEQPSQIDTPSEPTSVNTPVAALPQPTTTPAASLPTGNSAAGIIAPEQGDPDGEGGLTLPSTGDANIGSIVGGVLGGVAGLALICALLFFCLRKRRPREPRWIEKKVEGPRFMEKVKSVPAGVSVMFAKVKGMKKGPARNPYRRHSQNDSVSSVYSTNTSGRVGSVSEPQDFFSGEPPVRRSSSRKSERNLLRKKNGSVSSQLAFAGILEEKDTGFDPFADPEPPRILHLSNPDAASPRGPLTPQPAATSARLSKDPFASPFDDPGIAPNGSIGSLPLQGHKRNLSSASALSSHPPSFIFPGPTATNNGTGPPQPKQAVLPNQKRRSSMAFPTFDATSTGASRDSELLRFGEPGPSRPGTNLFTPGLPTGRTVRQSDPFDLDRPEVLGFGNVIGRREVRASVTRQGTRGKRTSSVGNWGVTTDGPYPSLNPTGRR
ncbi:hypothetical protein FB567DRAFT_113146 [Paraphoma chrysanthemicola]|uniref:Uncharacterized protein n=1 Tax=Paraphoma chrysanthemicola TaxID=798071 RepID=A0A8K0R2E1_9PLEO|nr:hypothetical protein FB567DRAFT_113146 [Paraphoma chrysanthemicola]